MRASLILLFGTGGAGSGVWTRGSMIAREKEFGRVRLSTNALKIKHGGHSVDSCFRKSFVEFFSQSATVTLYACFGEFGSTLEGIPDVLDGIKTLSRGEFNHRKHMFTFDGEFAERFLVPGPGVMISKLVIGAFRTNILHREDMLADIK